MSIGSETAEQMTREAIQISEAAAKLAALGAKNLAALCLALHISPKDAVRRAQERREAERGERDERNVAIREKAAYASWYWTLYLLWGAFFITLFLGSGFPTALVSVLIVLHCVFLMVNMNRWAKRM